MPFLTLYVANDYFFPYITGKNFAFRIITEVVFVSWGVLCLLDAKYRPKFSWVLSTFSVLLIVMFFANLFGQHPQSSFWSNFERMDGYVTLVHVFLYVVVLGSMLTTKKAWNYFLNTTLVAACITALYGIAQYTGMIEGFTAGRRIESYLGNAAYLSIYMLFHIFIAFWMLVESKVTMQRVIYALMAVMFTYALMNSGTRGTVLGLGVGVGVMVTYIILFGAKYKEFRRYAIGAFILLVAGVGVFILGKDTAFIQENPNLARVANIDLGNDLRVRGTIWGMAWEGVKERPVLGYGMGNFNYVFNEKYEPFLFDQEQWFDRAHNIFMDWLVAGGFVGLVAYLAVFAACVYYLLIAPFLKKGEEQFTVLERGVLLGILAGYFTHNIVVFDNIVSYMFFAVILALIHSRVGVALPSIENFKMDRPLIVQFVAPVAAVFLFAIIYTVNVPNMNAATDIIEGYRATTAADRLASFKQASERGSFAQQEIAEQIAQQAMAVVRDPNVSEELKREYVALAESQLLKLATDKPGDARIHVFIGSFYRAIGDLEAATTQMDIARELSPEKQSIIAQQAIIAYSKNDYVTARDLFKESLDLDGRNNEAREFYAAMLFLNGEGAEAKALVTNEDILNRFALNDFLIGTVNQTGDFAFMIDLYEARIKQNPKNEQDWASLAFLYSQAGDTQTAVETLREAGRQLPPFAPAANCIADNIQAGREPQLGCQ